MKIIRENIQLRPRTRGMHLVTEEIESNLPGLHGIGTGVAHVYIQHTSASLTLNENADPSVRTDMERHFREIAPDRAPYYTHTAEGPDDMSAHIKASLLGSSLTIPVTNGRFDLGTWQGIYLCEHREHGGSRRIVITVLGEE